MGDFEEIGVKSCTEWQINLYLVCSDKFSLEYPWWAPVIQVMVALEESGMDLTHSNLL